MTNDTRLDGKIVAITGGGGVLCGALAKAIAGAGASVVVLDLNEEAAKSVAGEITRSGGKAIAIKCDVLDKESLQEAHGVTAREFGPVNVLINGAGGNKKEGTTSEELSFFDLPAEAVRFVFDLNVLSALLTSQVFARNMAESGDGVILNISSMNAFRPLTKIPAYSAAKAAVSNFTQWLAVHLCRNYSPKIRVNAIAPGFFLTDQNRFLLVDEASEKLTPRGKSIIDHTPMERFGTTEDLLGAVLWLLSDSASFITGVVLPIDGGFSAFSGV